MKKITCRGRVTDEGKLLLNDSDKFKSDLVVFSGKEIDLTVTKTSKPKTLNQNSFLHGPIIEIIQRGFLDAGYKEARDYDWVRNVLKWKFLREPVVNSDGEFMTDDDGQLLYTVPSIADLNKDEFSEFIDKVVTWSLEALGVDIEAEYTDFKNVLNQILIKYQS